MKRNILFLSGILACVLSFHTPEIYLSPGALAVDEKAEVMYTALTTGKAIAVTDLKSGVTTARIALKQSPNHLLLTPGGATLVAACGEEKGCVEVIALPGRKEKASIPVGHTPSGMAVTPDGKYLYVANRFSNSVSVIDLPGKKVVATLPTAREPRAVYITPDGHTVAVADFLPAQAASADTVAAQITLIDVSANTVRARVMLPNGAQSVRALAGSPDGKYLYAVHLLSRYGMPITQMDRGWVNTNALSMIRTDDGAVYATVLLDDVDHGAANPAGMDTDGNGHLFITLSGTHELMCVDMNGLHEKLNAFFSGKMTDPYLHDSEDLSSSLSFAASCKQRIALNGRSPREVAFANGIVYVSSYFSPFLEAIPAGDPAMTTVIPLGDEPAPDAVRRGALAFHDASICYQQWQSCASCHPDGRVDGLNWDQQNDGLGNPKNTKSLLYAHVTPPCMITGIRESAEQAVRNGILHTLQTNRPESLAADMDEYLRHLSPVASPYLQEYKRKDPRQKGQMLFAQIGCFRCHSGKYLTDQAKYDVGTGDGNDAGRAFDTPSLRELWRTAPYLYDGRAATLRDIFTKYNPDNKHGLTNRLNSDELDALILYLNTL
ncbi:MAG: beta-propeller fold lactonase family protein [Tannerella sp.]|jgi:YVTN family beta-propeller protein|nr:beta-propeller fold lactonase family protein [Tannerella sp.]